jgi:hypothetical protein
MDLELAAMGLNGEDDMEEDGDDDEYDFNVLKKENKGGFMASLASQVLNKSIPQNDDDDDEDL